MQIHPLQIKIQAIARCVRWLKILYLLGWVVSLFFASLTLLAGLDFLFRYQDPGLRILSSCTLMVVVLWSCYYFIGSAIQNKLSEIDIAQQLEHRFPTLQSQLSSTIAFLAQSENDHHAGSATLRRNVINQTTTIADTIDFNEAIQWRPIQRISLVVLLVTLIVGTLCFIQPMSAKLATTRILLPLGDYPWPQIHRLRIDKKVTRLAYGRTFQITVSDQSGTLPQEVMIHYRYHPDQHHPDQPGEAIIEQEQMIAVGNQVIARKEKVTQSFDYRVTGGDDNEMSWIKVHVVQPPGVISSTVKVIPPKYLGWEPTTVEQSFEALIGSQILFSATASKPLKQATLMLESGQTVNTTLTADRRSFSIGQQDHRGWKLDESRSYWFELIDQEGIKVDSDKWEIRPISDTPPSVIIENPTGTVYATTAASLPLQVRVRDDLSISEIQLNYSIITAGKTILKPSIPLYRGPSQPENRKQISSDRALTTNPDLQDDRKQINYSWELKKLALQPGTSIKFHITASDNRDPKPQSSESSKLRIVIVSQQQLENRLAAHYRNILNQLRTVLNLQRSIQSQCVETQTQLSISEPPTKKVSDQLQAAEIKQRQVTNLITGGPESSVAQLNRLSKQLQLNHVESSELAKRIKQLQAELTLIVEKQLRQTEHHLATASKSLQLDRAEGSAHNKRPTPPVVLKNLNQAIRYQQQIIHSLSELLGELIQWDSFHQLKRDLKEVQSQQKILLSQTAKLGQETFGKQLQDLTVEQKAILNHLSVTQMNLADRIPKITGRMKTLVDQGTIQTPADVESLKAAIHFSQQHSIRIIMQDAAGGIKKNRIGQASQLQSQANEAVKQLIDIFESRDQKATSQQVDQLLQHDKQLQKLLDQQKQLRAELENLQQKPSPEINQEFITKQQSIKKQSQDLARNLRRGNAHQAAKVLDRAAEKMKRLSAGLKTNNFQPEESLLIEKDLEKALALLRQLTRGLEDEELRAEFLELYQKVKKLSERQRHLLTQSVELLKKNQEELGRRAFIRKVQNLHKLQQQLTIDTQGTAKIYQQREIIHLALKNAIREMTEATLLLSGREVNQETIDLQQQALSYLQQLLRAIKPEDAELTQVPDQNQNTNPNEKSNKKRSTLAEVRLLRLMQIDLLQKTKQLEKSKNTNGKLTESQQRLYRRLAESQGRLALLFAQLVNLEENP